MDKTQKQPTSLDGQQLVYAKSGLCNCRRVGAANLPVTLFQSSSSKSGMRS